MPGACRPTSGTATPGRRCTARMGSPTSRTPCSCRTSGRSPSSAATSGRCSDSSRRCRTVSVDDLRSRIERHIREYELIPPGGEVVALVSGGADSTCLWHALGSLGYRVSALHVNHGLRGEESEGDARFCRELMGAEVVEAPPAATEAELRDLRYSFAI